MAWQPRIERERDWDGNQRTTDDDTIRVLRDPASPRFQYVVLSDRHGFLVRYRRCGIAAGPVRHFLTEDAAKRAADRAWPTSRD